jgi:hypothetical protein
MKHLFALLVLAGASVNASTINLDLGLVANYTFQQNENDITGNVSNSVVGGQQTTGVYGNGWQFTQAGQQIVGTSVFLPTGNSPRTISAWIRADSLNPEMKPVVLGGISPYNNGDVFGVMRRFNGMWSFWANGFAFESYTSNQVDLNWHHHLLSYDNLSGIAYYYIDAVLNATWSGSLNTYGQTLSFASIDDDSNGFGFIGALDEVRVYSRAITSQDEINALYAVPEPSSISLLALGGVVVALRRLLGQNY